jgi:hypothetical protein
MTCKQVAGLLSEGREHELSWTQRWMIRFHLLMCVSCRRFSKQLEFIHRVSQTAGDAAIGSLASNGNIFNAALPDEARSRMKRALAHGGF